MLPAKEIFDAALQLPADERARLVAELSATLEGLELSEDWENEIVTVAHCKRRPRYWTGR